MLLAPQYATFGLQTFCDRAPEPPLDQPDCSNNKNSIKPCSGPTDNPAAQQVCTPSIASTFLNRITHNYPFFGAIFFWAQFLFLGLYLVTFLSFLVRSQDLGERQLDEDAEEAEEEGLLPRNGRRFMRRLRHRIPLMTICICGEAAISGVKRGRKWPPRHSPSAYAPAHLELLRARSPIL
jgi:hypothetical protein